MRACSGALEAWAACSCALGCGGEPACLDTSPCVCAHSFTALARTSLCPTPPEGELVYSGPADGVLPHFESLGHTCPAHFNPAGEGRPGVGGWRGRELVVSSPQQPHRYTLLLLSLMRYCVAHLSSHLSSLATPTSEWLADLVAIDHTTPESEAESCARLEKLTAAWRARSGGDAAAHVGGALGSSGSLAFAAGNGGSANKPACGLGKQVRHLAYSLACLPCALACHAGLPALRASASLRAELLQPLPDLHSRPVALPRAHPCRCRCCSTAACGRCCATRQPSWGVPHRRCPPRWCLLQSTGEGAGGG